MNNLLATDPGHVPGFWSGIWDGITSPFMLIAKMFDYSIEIYETFNNGLWYDFGFIWGFGLLFWIFQRCD